MDNSMMAMEVRHRTKEHAKANTPLRSAVFRRAHMSIERNMLLGTLFHNSHIWTALNKTDMKSINIAYLKGLRCLLYTSDAADDM
eukprot:4716163-Karenia_brevis.AAC.1